MIRYSENSKPTFLVDVERNKRFSSAITRLNQYTLLFIYKYLSQESMQVKTETIEHAYELLFKVHIPPLYLYHQKQNPAQYTF
jgi:hypothetical protein